MSFGAHIKVTCKHSFFLAKAHSCTKAVLFLNKGVSIQFVPLAPRIPTFTKSLNVASRHDKLSPTF